MVKKFKSEEVEDFSVNPSVLEERTLSYPHWFDLKLKQGEVSFYQIDSLLVFFKKKGLTEIENPDSYEKAFLKF